MRRILFLVFAALLALGRAVVAGEDPAVEGVKYRVVINHEEQYSIWMAEDELPKAWKATGFVGSKEEALDYIEEVWIDMRPLSERRETALEIYQKLLVAGKKPVVEAVEYRVVINHEEQYSIWMAEDELPKAWKATGFVGSKEEALDYIEEVWTDMRPLSERRETALEIYQKLQREK